MVRKLFPRLITLAAFSIASVALVGATDKTPSAPPEPKHAQQLPKDVPTYMQSVSVTIRSNSGEGSGTVIIRDGRAYILTAAHVVDGLRSERVVVDPKTGTKRTLVEFDDAKVVKVMIEGGRTVGRVELDAKVLKYSDADHGEDLALLRVRAKSLFRESGIFYDEGAPPKLGTRLLHCGSLLGSIGSNSMTDGIMSAHGRLIGKTVYDQTTVTAFPGSSGGMVCLTDGRYVGMIVRGAGEGFNLIVPVRRMREWAKRVGVLWVLDPREPVPSEKELSSMPIEDIGSNFGGK